MEWTHKALSPKAGCAPYTKKNDRSEIANYRPITLLNTDYKIYSKALSIRLALAAPLAIHKTQAGFIPGRQISDQTQLVQMVIDYANKFESDGMIVALDQEKAYDKIAHDYMWRVLHTFKIPNEYINKIKNLYSHAKTQVCVNGEMSKPYKVKRGVRQGDPLSCLLFNLAIEPLAIALRKSELKGMNIPGEPERLIETMFADDTTVYLDKIDPWELLMLILDDWCKASRAKFNKGKTEIIPIGSNEYRRTFEITQKTTQGNPIPEDVRIVPKGAAVRILGAWFGHDVEVNAPWMTVISKIDKAVERWNNARVTTLGRQHVIQSVFGGYTQYLTMVQGMPKDIENMIKKRLRRYLWNKKVSDVNAETTRAPIECGGLKVLDITSRNEAIDVMWLKRYLTFGDDRPTWARIMDTITANTTPTTEKEIPVEIRVNVFLQTWKTITGYKKEVHVPKSIRRILSIAKKYGLRIETLSADIQTQRSMPVWLHTESGKKMRRLTLSKQSRCLIEKHKIRTVGEARDLVERMNVSSEDDHAKSDECECKTCMQLENDLSCMTPHGCAEQAKRVLDTIPNTWNARPDQTKAPNTTKPTKHNKNEALQCLGEVTEDKEGNAILEMIDWVHFSKQIDSAQTIGAAFRIFTSGDKPITSEDIQNAPDTRELVIIGTDGSCTNNGKHDAKAGAGGFIDEYDDRSYSIRVPRGQNQSNQTGELLAIAHIGHAIPNSADVYIETDSTYAMNAVTVHLKENEDKGYVGVANKEMIQYTVSQLRKHMGATYLKWVKGHSGLTQNEGADCLAGIGANMEDTTKPLPVETPNMRMTGVKVTKLTQKLAYQAIREMRMMKYKN
jgi:ribonuclease HI